MNLLDAISGYPAPALAVMIIGLILASLARGYSGFGFSALLISSWALVTDPAKAVVLALMLEMTASVFQAASVWKDIPWKRVGLLLAGAVIGTPAGVYLLAQTDPDILRLGIAAFVLISALALMSGLKLKTKSHPSSTAAVGVASGVCNGAVAMGGLPVALFLTADGDNPRVIRAAIIAYFFLLDLIGLGFLGHQGLISFDIFQMAILSLPVLLIGMYLGQRHFLGATPEGFRRVTLILLITLSTLGIIRAFMG